MALEKFLLIGAVLGDALWGDPQSRWHPVALIGRWIAWWEQCLFRPQASSGYKQVAGAVLALLVVGSVYSATWLLHTVFYQAGPWVGVVGDAVLLSFAIAPRTLAAAGREIARLLRDADLAAARQKVGLIVGRDTQNLTVAEIIRATVETVAENITDGIIAPLFYALCGGMPLAFAYRAVNTLDSMVGYRNERYRDFGKFSARLDDVANFLPARLTGLLLVPASLLLGLDYRRAWQVMRRDAGKHPSPNSGIAEAAVAGALGIRLGGLNYYGGVASFRAYMGDAIQPLTDRHIEQTCRLMYVVVALFLALAMALLFLWPYLARQVGRV